jgi:polysaccharide biosynthesis protein PslH
MRLLFLTPQLPYPPHQGTTIRNYNILKQIAPRHDITLLSFGTKEQLANAEPLCHICRQIEMAPYPTRSFKQRLVTTLSSPLPDMALRLESREMAERASKLVENERFDVIQIEGIEMARYVTRSRPPGRSTRIIFDDHNAEYVLQRTAFEADVRKINRWHAAIYSMIQWQKLARYEQGICRLADAVIVASNADARAIQRLGIRDKVHVVPNGVDTDHFVPSEGVCAKPLSELALVYAGKMDFRPNVDAMVWFCAEILPRIRASIPLAHLVIVGQQPPPRILALGKQDGVEVTGWVPDTRPYVADSAVYVVPLRMGSGTRLKVLEAMAMGKAIVSTALGAEGIDLVPGQDAIIANTPSEFAQAVVDLLQNPRRRQELGQAGRQLVEFKYDWRTLVPKLDSLYLK